MRRIANVLLVFAVSLAGCATRPAPPETAPFSVQLFNKLPSTPSGALNADVTQANIKKTICVAGWTATVRPPTSYTNPLKAKLLEDYDLPPSDAAKYELDHFVPLALGGHPTSHDNLWLQPWEGQWGAKTKDRLERKLQLMVCAGQLTLDQARHAIRTNWVEAFKKYVGAAELIQLMAPVE